MIPNIPTTATIFAGIASKIPKTVTAKLQRAATTAMEAAAIIAPFVDRGVSWRTINESLYTSIEVLSSEGIISSELNVALINTVSDINSVNNTVNSLQNIANNMTTNNLTESLYNIDIITATLRTQSSSLSRTVDFYAKTVDENKTLTTINNTPTETQQSIDELNEYITVGISNITRDLNDINNLYASINSLGFDATGRIPQINEAIIEINRVNNVVMSTKNIADNLLATTQNVKNIANNISKINNIMNNKRKKRKTLPTLPAAIDPRNSQYVSLYNSLNTTIDSFNSTITTLSSIPKIPFL